ncbi:DUF3093 domain-containing protein [Naasia aerilata]|uniref:DUF3093 domain-containing protein n=1 Tax=Naasia aerilata TaxID=1162966 RepID=A0ABN6XPU4_9MICO|nr:DUF3093 domain-containing protein [Naasia aerilata]BDZ46881.1 hypothetical protein GCM10025866_27900 [Naasia aerilata]
MTYRERLSPSPWMYLALALLIPASLLVFLPISVPAGIACAIVLFGGACLFVALSAPVVEVADGHLRAGRARIPLEFTAAPEAFRGAAATAARGVDLDARAWLCIRGGIDPVVRVQVTDPADPAPYWLISTRNPDLLVAALQAAHTLG